MIKKFHLKKNNFQDTYVSLLHLKFPVIAHWIGDTSRLLEMTLEDKRLSMLDQVSFVVVQLVIRSISDFFPLSNSPKCSSS